MNPSEIVDLLTLENFEPCVFITNSGERYEARHPEFVHVTPNGTIRIYEPTTDEGTDFELFVRVSSWNIAAIAPLRMYSK